MEMRAAAAAAGRRDLTAGRTWASVIRSSREGKHGSSQGAMMTARSLQQQGVQLMLGVVGSPVEPIFATVQRAGISNRGMCNE